MRPRERVPTLLVIEDTSDEALLVAVAARRAHPGLDVRIASDGAEAIAYLTGAPPFEEQLSRPTPDLAILDLSMPKVDGFGVLTWIKERPGSVSFPVVVLTSSTSAEDRGRALDLGAVAVHEKPAELKQLGEVVREIVHRWIGKGRIIGAHIWEAG